MPRDPSGPFERLLRSSRLAAELGVARVEAPRSFAHSGTARFVQGRDGRRYKLRVCSSARRAKEIETLLAAEPAIFPAVLGREGRLLWMEALGLHRALSREELIERLAGVGGMVARLHAAAEAKALPSRAGQLRAAARARLQLARDLRLLRAGTLDGVSARAVAAKLAAGRRRFGLPLAVELDDIHKANLMLRPRDGDLRYVDEEGVAVRPLFTSLASLVKTADKREHWEAFRAGYARLRDASVITPEYTEYVVLQDTLRKVANKVRAGAKLGDERRAKLPFEIDDLRRVAFQETPNLDWDFFRG
ncbi:MAG TPA: hypothetical protein VHQ66_03710 [Myxococcota bacterium]|nr:hypothetical protein [Myxococcota bacterium]